MVAKVKVKGKKEKVIGQGEATRDSAARPFTLYLLPFYLALPIALTCSETQGYSALRRLAQGKSHGSRKRLLSSSRAEYIEGRILHAV